jgi:hypothetical protein
MRLKRLPATKFSAAFEGSNSAKQIVLAFARMARLIDPRFELSSKNETTSLTPLANTIEMQLSCARIPPNKGLRISRQLKFEIKSLVTINRAHG